MANPKRENGTTDIANDIIEAIIRIHLSGYENRVLLAIFRKTYGWHKKEDWLSNSQIAKMTNIQESHVSRTIKTLIQKNIVTKNGKKLGVQKDYDKWWKLPKMVQNKNLPIQDKNIPKMVTKLTKNGTKNIPKMVHTKQNKTNYTKQTIQNKEKFPFLKDKDFIETFKDYLDMRKEKKPPKPATDRAKELVLISLHKHDVKTAITMLENSIKNSWTDVYELKNNYNKQQTQGGNYVQQGQEPDKYERAGETVNIQPKV